MGFSKVRTCMTITTKRCIADVTIDNQVNIVCFRCYTAHNYDNRETLRIVVIRCGYVHTRYIDVKPRLHRANMSLSTEHNRGAQAPLTEVWTVKWCSAPDLHYKWVMAHHGPLDMECLALCSTVGDRVLLNRAYCIHRCKIEIALFGFSNSTAVSVKVYTRC